MATTTRQHWLLPPPPPPGALNTATASTQPPLLPETPMLGPAPGPHLPGTPAPNWRMLLAHAPLDASDQKPPQPDPVQQYSGMPIYNQDVASHAYYDMAAPCIAPPPPPGRPPIQQQKPSGSIATSQGISGHANGGRKGGMRIEPDGSLAGSETTRDNPGVQGNGAGQSESGASSPGTGSRPNSRGGVAQCCRGVYFDQMRNLWRANWPEETVIVDRETQRTIEVKRCTRTKGFSAKKYGYAESQRLAMAHRARMINSGLVRNIVYSDTVGGGSANDSGTSKRTRAANGGDGTSTSKRRRCNTATAQSAPLPETTRGVPPDEPGAPLSPSLIGSNSRAKVQSRLRGTRTSSPGSAAGSDGTPATPLAQQSAAALQGDQTPRPCDNSDLSTSASATSSSNSPDGSNTGGDRRTAQEAIINGSTASQANTSVSPGDWMIGMDGPGLGLWSSSGIDFEFDEVVRSLSSPPSQRLHSAGDSSAMTTGGGYEVDQLLGTGSGKTMMRGSGLSDDGSPTAGAWLSGEGAGELQNRNPMIQAPAESTYGIVGDIQVGGDGPGRGMQYMEAGAPAEFMMAGQELGSGRDVYHHIVTYQQQAESYQPIDSAQQQLFYEHW